MTPERLEIARRFVACPKWVWLRGMSAIPVDGLGIFETADCIHGVDESLITYSGARIAKNRRIPDLDDDLTRLGLLAVVRRAWAGYIVRGPSAPLWDPEPIWTVLVGDDAIGEAVEFDGPSEEAALLAALEACT